MAKVEQAHIVMANYIPAVQNGEISTGYYNYLFNLVQMKKFYTNAHPHIGTNKLPGIITAMRKQIIECGGEFLFEKKVIDFIIQNEKIRGVKTSDGDLFEADALLLATGHSARDIFQLLHAKNIMIESKGFCIGCTGRTSAMH